MVMSFVYAEESCCNKIWVGPTTDGLNRFMFIMTLPYILCYLNKYYF